MENTQPRTVYGLVDPRDGRVRYVGATVDTDRRLRAHVRTAGHRHEGVERGRWLLDLADAGLGPILVILEENIPAAVWRTREREWIAHFVPAQLVNGEPGFEKGRTIAAGPRVYPAGSAPSTLMPDDIRAFRSERGWSQGELARRLGVHYATVSLWEAGKRRIPERTRLALERLSSIP